MARTHVLIPVAVLGILTAWLASSPSPEARPEQRSAPPTVQTESQAASVAQAPDDPFDALEVLAESFGIDISSDGLKRLAIREGTILNDPGRDNDRIGEAREFVEFFTALATTQLNMPAVPAPDYNTLVEAFFKQQPLDISKLQFETLREAARRNHTDVSFLIATLPDPIDSFTGWQFDPMLDAIAQAVSASDYIFERYHFPDSDHDSSDAATRGRAHESEASVILFRRHWEGLGEPDGSGQDGGGKDPTGKDAWRRERLVLLIVHENPSAGVHARALVNAIRVVTGWDSAAGPDADHSVIRILGPTFSGSADSLARQLAQADRRRLLDRYTVRFVSGSATDFANKSILEDALRDPPCTPRPATPRRCRVSFQATVQPDRALMPRLIEQIDKAGWSPPVAVLFEGNTQYGRGMLNALTGHTSGPLRREDLILLPFPMNVSRIRASATGEKTGLADVLGLPSRHRPLWMETPGQPADQIPQLSRETSASYVELALSSMLQTMRKEDVGTVALMATDPRDKLFLAQQIARDLPNTSIFTAEIDSVYVHPDYSSYLQGALVASTYALYSGNQRWSYGFQGGSERLEFANSSAKGIYNAALALLNYDENGKPLNREYAAGEAPPRLIEYGAPGEDCTKGCAPPVWISVVGRRGTWPVQAYQVPASDYVLRITINEPTAPPRLVTFPSRYFHAVILIMTAIGLVCWAGAQSATWRRSSGFTRRMAALVGGSGHEPGRKYLLAGLASLLVMELFVAAIYVTRVRLDAPSWEWSFLGSLMAAVSVAITSLALVDLARRITSRLLTHDRENLSSRFDPRTWSGRASLVAVTFCIWGAASLQYYVWTHAFEPREFAVSFVARAIDFASGVSPTLPVLFLGFAIVTWSLAELARLRTPCVALAEASVHPLMQQTVGGSLHRFVPAWNRLNHSTLSVPNRHFLLVCLMLAVTCLFVFDPIVRPLITFEGPWFGRFVSSAILIVQAMISLSLLQFLYLWTSLKHLFEQMAWHRPVPAYQKVPRVLSSAGLFPRVPRLRELHLLVAHWTCALDKAGRQADSHTLNEQFQAERQHDDAQLWSKSGTWRSLLAATEPSASSHPQPTGQERELLMEMCAALVVRDAIARLGHNLLFVIGGVLFVFCSHTLFPFQLDEQLAQLAWVYVALAFGSILMVLLQMKRNEILRRLTSADPTTRTTWDGAFFWRVAVFALIPLLTLFAAQFPDIGGVILKWIDPVRTVLP